MTEQISGGALAVRRDVTVQGAPEHAFAIFTESLSASWPLATHTTGAQRGSPRALAAPRGRAMRRAAIAVLPTPAVWFRRGRRGCAANTVTMTVNAAHPPTPDHTARGRAVPTAARPHCPGCAEQQAPRFAAEPQARRDGLLARFAAAADGGER
jgi:hypothetical protein